jgi:hypothetical protein
LAKRIGQLLAVFGFLAGAGARAETPQPIGLQCTAVGTWTCAKGKSCAQANRDDVQQDYDFDLMAMTYRAPDGHGAITELETEDRGFMTFLIGGGRRYVYKKTGESGPMTAFLYLSPTEMRQLQCHPRYASTAADEDAGDRRALAGHYYLSGVMETGSELLLRPDGSFAWFMSYGAVDQEAEGKWRVGGDAVLLDSRPKAGAEPAFRQLRLRIDHGALLLDGTDKGRYERHR